MDKILTEKDVFEGSGGVKWLHYVNRAEDVFY